MPQHAKRIKVRRKDLRKPDEFETLTGQAVDWAQANRPLVGGIIIAALVVAIIALGAARWRSSRDEAAAAAFNLAHVSFTDGKFGDAARAFEDVSTTYSRAPFGRLAGLYRAHALARSGDPAGAATVYAEYLARSPDSEYLRQEALDGLGRAKEASGCFAFFAYCGSLSRSGPIVAFEPAGVYVWHAVQPSAVKSPFPCPAAEGFAIVPTTVCGSGRAVPWLPQPATTSATTTNGARTTTGRRIARESTDSQRTSVQHPSAPRKATSTGESLTRNETTSAMSSASTVGPLRMNAAIATITARPTANSASFPELDVTVR